MPRDLRDVWRDEDGPSDAEIERWSSGEITQLILDADSRRVLRHALKAAWSNSPDYERAVIDHLLAQVKHL